MKLRFSTRSMPHSTNPHRLIPSNTLHVWYHNSIFISHPHLPRRKLRLTNPIPTRQRRLNIFHLPIPPCGTRTILWILHFPRNLKHWDHPTICSHSNCIHGLCTPMRTNIILRSYSNYKPIISYPLHWDYPSRMNLRRLLSRQSNPNTLLRIPLHPPIHYRRPCNCTSSFPPRNRIK